MVSPLRILLLEDKAKDAELQLDELRRAGFRPEAERVQTEGEFTRALRDRDFDIVLADYELEQFDGVSALKILQKVKPDVPFILISGALDEELAVQSVKHGASDYLIKDRLARLGRAVARALDERHLRADRATAEYRLQQQRKATIDVQREGDARVTAILESAQDAILSIDQEGRILDFNSAAETLFGCSSRDVVGRAIEGWIQPADSRNIHPGSFVRLLRSGQGAPLLARRLEVRAVRGDGSSVPAELTITRIRAEGRTIFTGFLRDISDRKQMEEALRRQTEQTLRHQRALLELAALDKAQFAPTLEQIIRTDAATLEIERVSFWVLEDDALHCELLYRRSRDLWEFGHLLSSAELTRYMEALRTEPVIAAHEAQRDPRTADISETYLQPLGIASILDVPVWHAGKLVGVVCHEHVGSPRKWTAEEQKFAVSIGHMVALALAGNERQNAERALRESEERFRVTFEQAAVGIGHGTTNGKWTWANQRLCDILGYKREQLLGRTWMDITYPLDLDESLKGVSQLLSGEITNLSQDKRFLRADGAPIWVNVSSSVKRNVLGEPDYLILVVQEITDRKRAEERVIEQANLLDLTHDAIIVRNLDDRILFWNQGAEKLYGISELRAIGQRESDLLYADTWDFDTAKQAVLAKGEWHGELRQSAPGKKDVVVDARWTLVRDERGEAKSILAINTDITSRKALEEQFLRAQRLESIGTLASGVAHDLNNILAPILMAVPMLRGELPEDLRESLVSTIETSAQRGADIVRQVLTFARGVEGERVLLQPFHLLREMEKIATETFPKTLVVRNRADRDLWPVNGDATQLHQVLMNLCVNARDAMVDGGILMLEAENFSMDESYAAMTPGARAGDYVVLKVSDTGTGIPREIVDKVFDPFFTTKEPGQGTGLGLSTVMGIVRSHGGFLNVQSESGRGTTFHVYLPATTDGLLGPETAAPCITPKGHGELILVVDDEEGVRDVTQAVLRKNNYEVLVAADGTEALAAFAQRPRDVSVVVTDVVMPHIDGVALTRALRKLNPDVRVVASTGHAQNHRAAELRSLDVQGFLNKPFSAETLLQVVHSALHS
ncbi:PAS domain S-box protein [Verrucomicrobiota bacterium sgz303538]